MSQRHSDHSSQTLQCSSSSEISTSRDGKSGTLRNRNGKRLLDYTHEDRPETPHKYARLDSEHNSNREERQQQANPIADDSNPNHEQDFTAGPGHIVFIDERGKSCPAFCFNKGLFNTFNHMAECSRDLQETDKALQKAQFELERMKSSNQSADLEKAKRIVEESMKNQEEIEGGIPGFIEARRQYDTLTQEHNRIQSLLDHKRWLAQMVIEQILKGQKLLEIPRPKPEKPVEDTKPHSWEPSVVPEKTDDRYQSAPPSPSTTRMEPPMDAKPQFTPRQIALHDLRFAAEEYEYRRGEFTFTQEEYPQEAAAERRYRQEQDPDRPASTTQTDFDLETLQRKQQATRKVVEAKEKYDRAEEHAVDLGLGDILADPQACYYGEVFNDFSARTSRCVAVFPVNRPRIEAWLASIPDVAVVDSQKQGDAEIVEVDDWNARPLEIFDSISQFASDMYRQKIDKWQDISTRLREGEAERLSLEAVR